MSKPKIYGSVRNYLPNNRADERRKRRPREIKIGKLSEKRSWERTRRGKASGAHDV